MSPDEIKDSLERLGYKLHDRGSYWQTSALFRNGDNQTALQIYKNSGVWKDYVEGTTFNNFKKLIQVTLGTNDPNELKKYLSGEDPFKFSTSKNAPAEKIEMEEIYPVDMLDRLLPHYKFYNNKGISTGILQSLKGGLATSGKLNQRFVFPIFNQDLQIHGFSGRDIYSSENSNRPKWKHVGRKTSWIYPTYTDNSTEKSINDAGHLILVESIGDLLNLKENGIHNVMVSFGLDFSSKLLSYIVSLNPDKIVISLNNDDQSTENRGKIASHKNYLKMVSSLFMSEKIRICPPVKNDFGDMNLEDFELWRSNLENPLEENQSEAGRSYCKEIAKQGLISRNLSKNIKRI